MDNLIFNIYDPVFVVKRLLVTLVYNLGRYRIVQLKQNNILLKTCSKQYNTIMKSILINKRNKQHFHLISQVFVGIEIEET